MNNLENKEILSEEILKAIDVILEYCPNVVFGGSIALNAIGLINRKISDIDLFFPETESLSRNGFLNIHNKTEMTSDTVTNTNGKVIQRTGAKIYNTKVCCFKVEQEELQCSKFSFLGRTIFIQNVNYAIQAKIAYSSKNPKNEKDLSEINEILNEYF
jgi:hypothetical protein